MAPSASSTRSASARSAAPSSTWKVQRTDTVSSTSLSPPRTSGASNQSGMTSSPPTASIIRSPPTPSKTTRPSRPLNTVALSDQTPPKVFPRSRTGTPASARPSRVTTCPTMRPSSPSAKTIAADASPEWNGPKARISSVRGFITRTE